MSRVRDIHDGNWGWFSKTALRIIQDKTENRGPARSVYTYLCERASWLCRSYAITVTYRELKRELGLGQTTIQRAIEDLTNVKLVSLCVTNEGTVVDILSCEDKNSVPAQVHEEKHGVPAQVQQCTSTGTPTLKTNTKNIYPEVKVESQSNNKTDKDIQEDQRWATTLERWAAEAPQNEWPVPDNKPWRDPLIRIAKSIDLPQEVLNGIKNLYYGELDHRFIGYNSRDIERRRQEYNATSSEPWYLKKDFDLTMFWRGVGNDPMYQKMWNLRKRIFQRHCQDEQDWEQRRRAGLPARV
jgi:hypothetical protein